MLGGAVQCARFAARQMQRDDSQPSFPSTVQYYIQTHKTVSKHTKLYPKHTKLYPKHTILYPNTQNCIQTHKRFKRTLFIRTKTQSANFRGNPVCQATEQRLNGSYFSSTSSHEYQHMRQGRSVGVMHPSCSDQCRVFESFSDCNFI